MGIQGDFILQTNPPTPFAKGGLKTGSLHTARRQLSAAGPDLYLFKRQRSIFSVQQTPKIQKTKLKGINAARLLGISRRTFYRKLEGFDLLNVL